MEFLIGRIFHQKTLTKTEVSVRVEIILCTAKVETEAV